MPRAADYTIQGFLYQFNKTIKEILTAENDQTITVEGIVEDIEVVSPETTKAIQCKYHETNTSFTASAIYKPLLQMLNHFAKHPSESIRYVLFAHFAGVITPNPTVGRETFEAALASKDKNLQKYITSLPPKIDLDGFEAKFVMEFGPSYDELVVTSRKVVWLFLEQLRLEFVPVLHRLQGRLAAQG